MNRDSDAAIRRRSHTGRVSYMSTEYDLVILGGGTGGYVAAVRASQLGLKTAIVEAGKLGGTCLHAGCIPSKALLRSAEVYQTVRRAADFGVIKAEGATFDFSVAQKRKQGIVDKLHSGVQYLIKQGKIDLYEGYGRLLGPSIFSPMAGTISVEMNNGEENEILIPKNVLLATGSRPRALDGLTIDGKTVLTSDEALKLTKLPSSMLIVGGGVIGVEWASMLADFDVDVTVIEYANRVLPTEDAEISREMNKALKKKGVKIITGAKVLPDTLSIESGLTILTQEDGTKREYKADKMLVSVGREANTKGIGLENTEIELSRGFIQVNESFQTKESHIYAIGDCIGGMQLAHVASHEGIKAVEHIAGLKTEPIRYDWIPRCIYGSPEAASVGITEEEAVKRGHKIKVGKFPFQALGKALVYGETEGFAKIISDEDSDDLLGVHMVGPHVTDMISEAGLALVLDATAWEVASSIHPHPSLSEVMGEAALAVDGMALHM